MNPNIFKAYDIRGVYPEEINEDAVYKIGKAYAHFLNAKNVAVGRDIRQSSLPLYKSLEKGLTESGANIYYLGELTTPMLYYATSHLDVDGGIMITASHNPPEYNGLKLCRKDAVPIGEGSGMEDIKKLALEDEINQPEKKGEVTAKEIREEYLDYLASFAELGNKKFKIVVDPANSMSILEIPIYRKLDKNLELVTIFDEFDCLFPNHEANPLKTETLCHIQKKVQENSADLGIAYDGDGDRVGFIDEKGEIIPMDLITALLAQVVLEKNPGATILYDLRSSVAVKEIIEEHGGIARECRVGHALIKKQMREVNAIFAGELSGHYYFEENSKAECGSLPAIYLLNLMAKTGKPISELIQSARRYFHSGEINSEVKNKEGVIAKLKEKYKDGAASELDGIKISFWENVPGQRWWFNVRPSNTEPMLRLNVEADNKELMEEKKKELLEIIRA
jgi:phosphomannomutase